MKNFINISIFFLFSLICHAQNYEQLIKSGLQKIESKLYTEAMLDSEMALKFDKDKPDAYAIKGMCLVALGKYRDAIYEYSRAIKKTQASSQLEVLYFRRAVAKERDNFYSGAIEDYTKAIEFNPNNSDYYTLRAKLHEKYKKNILAIADYNKALEFKPVNELGILLTIGLIYYTEKDYESSLLYLNRGIEKDPTAIEAYKLRSNVYFYLKKYDMSLADMNRYIQSFPNDYDAYYTRGLAYSKLMKKNEAILDFSKVIDISPENSANAYLYRGAAYAELNDLVKACQDLKIAVDKKTFMASSYYYRFCKTKPN